MNLLNEKIEAAMLFGMLGDAAGASVEGYSCNKIIDKLGKEKNIKDFVYGEEKTRKMIRGIPLPQWTDDTCLAFLNWKTILEKENRISPYDAIDIWKYELPLGRDEKVDFNKFAPSTYTVREKLSYYYWEKEVKSYQSSAVDLRDLGRGVRMSVVGVLGIAPVAYINACHPRNAAIDAYELAGFSQEGHVRDGAASYSAAIAEALKPNSSIEDVLNKAKLHGGKKFAKKINDALSVVQQNNDMFTCIQKFDEKIKMPMWADPLELISIALAIFKFTGANVRKSILMSVYYGQDCDGIARFSGALCGAFKGFDGNNDIVSLAREIPVQFHNNLKKANITNPSPNSLLQLWNFDEFASRLTEIAVKVNQNNDGAVKMVEKMT